MEFKYDSGGSPIQDYFPRSLENLSNISRTTSVNLDPRCRIDMRLRGPSGSLYALGFCIRALNPLELEH